MGNKIKLAIKGHPTRGEEVIEILEMLGGINALEHCGNNTKLVYYINTVQKKWICCDKMCHLADYIILSLEEFLEKYPYKVGDKAFAFGNKCTIIDAVWDESIKEVVYTIKLDTSKYTTTKLSYQLQPYKEETMEAMNKEQASKAYIKGKLRDHQEYLGCEEHRRKKLITCDLYDLEQAFEDGWDAAMKELWKK